MNELFLGVCCLSLPLLVSGCGHMLAVRRGWLKRIAVPIHRTAFGANKTWRGVALMVSLTIVGVAATQHVEPLVGNRHVGGFADASPLVLGGLLGLAYVLAELPNSFLKRRLGIAPGRRSARHETLFVLLDQSDSVLGCALVYALVLDVSSTLLVCTVLVGPAIHLLANVLLHAAGLRRQPL